MSSKCLLTLIYVRLYLGSYRIIKKHKWIIYRLDKRNIKVYPWLPMIPVFTSLRRTNNFNKHNTLRESTHKFRSQVSNQIKFMQFNNQILLFDATIIIRTDDKTKICIPSSCKSILRNEKNYILSVTIECKSVSANKMLD